jgi:hypothetical protein
MLGPVLYVMQLITLCIFFDVHIKLFRAIKSHDDWNLLQSDIYVAQG